MIDKPDFNVEEETDGRLRVFRLAGDLVFDSAPALKDRFADHVDETDVVIELSGVGFMDSSGLAALLYARKRAVAEGWTLTLRRPRPNVAALLRLTARDSIFSIEP